MASIYQAALALHPFALDVQLEHMMHPMAVILLLASLAPPVKDLLQALHLLQTARLVLLQRLLLQTSASATQQARSMTLLQTRAAVLLALRKASPTALLFAVDARLESTP